MVRKMKRDGFVTRFPVPQTPAPIGQDLEEIDHKMKSPFKRL
jgi:hypothetical protein